LDHATEAALKAAIALMQAAGAALIEVSLPEVGPMLERAVASAMVEAAISHAHSYPSQRSLYSAAYAALLDTGLATSAADYAAVAIWRREFHGRLMRIFQGVDMIVAPVLAMAPPSVGEMAAAAAAPPLSAAPLTGYTIPFNLAGVPSLTLPMGRAPSGIPLGFQLIGPDLSEAALLSAGAAYEAACGYADLHPAL
jgi:amidase